MMKKIITILIALVCLQAEVRAQEVEEAQDTLMFYFESGSYEFLPTYMGNERTLELLKDYAVKYYEKLETGEYLIRVNTYSSGNASKQIPDRRLSYLRSLRMKSYMVLFREMQEGFFRTTNKVGTAGALTDVSIISFIVNPECEVHHELPVADEPMSEEAPAPEADLKVEAAAITTVVSEAKDESIIAENSAVAVEPIATETSVMKEELKAVAEEPEVVPIGEAISEEEPGEAAITAEKPEPELMPIPIAASKRIAKAKAIAAEPTPATASATLMPKTVNIRTNLLQWAMLTPNVGVEYVFGKRFSALLDGNWTHWNWKNGDRHYRLWSIAPSLRYRINEHWYAGVGYRGGEFGIKLSTDGKQGAFHAVGLQGGYLLRLNSMFSFDFGIGLGYINASYDKYRRIDGCNVNTATGIKKNYLGPTNVDVTLVWSFSNFISKWK